MLITWFLWYTKRKHFERSTTLVLHSHMEKCSLKAWKSLKILNAGLTWRPFCFFLPRMLITLVSVIYQKKAFWVLCNIDVAFSYWKIKSMGRKSQKTLNAGLMWRPFCFFLPRMLITLVSVIYQKKAFWALYNIGVAFSYGKMQSKGRKSPKTLNLWRPSWILRFCGLMRNLLWV